MYYDQKQSPGNKFPTFPVPNVSYLNLGSPAPARNAGPLVCSVLPSRYKINFNGLKMNGIFGIISMQVCSVLSLPYMENVIVANHKGWDVSTNLIEIDVSANHILLYYQFSLTKLANTSRTLIHPEYIWLYNNTFICNDKYFGFPWKSHAVVGTLNFWIC